MKKALSIIRKIKLSHVGEVAFLVWGIVIMSMYFYYYPQYGYAFLWSLILIVALVGFLGFVASVYFMARPMLQFLGREVDWKKIYEKISNRLKSRPIDVPILFFPAFLYASASLWIIYIFARSQDPEIVINDIVAVALTTILVILAYSLGARILKIFKYHFSDWLERFILSEAIGFGALMFIMYGLGMAGLYYRSVAYGLVGLIAAFTYREIIELWRYARSAKIQWNAYPIMSFKNLLLFSIAAIVFIYTAGMFQQYPIAWDALHTYAAFPKIYSESHRIVSFDYWIFSGFPQNGEMIFTLGYLLHYYFEIVGINYIFLLLSFLALLQLTKKLFNLDICLKSLFFFICLPITSQFNLFENKIDLILSFFSIAALYYLVSHIKTRKTIAFVISSVLFGIVAGIKYNFLYTIAPGCALVLIVYRKSWKDVVKKGLLLFVVIAILFLPWFAKNYHFTGNPVEPILGNILSNEGSFLRTVSPKGYSEGLRTIFLDAKLWYEDQDIKDRKFILTLPLRLTFEYKSRNLIEQNNPGPFYLLMIPIVFIFIKKNFVRDKYAYLLLLFSMTNIIVGLVCSHYINWYVYTSLIIFSIVISSFLEYLKNEKMRLLTSIFMAAYFMAFSINHLYARLKFNPLYIKLNESYLYVSEVSSYINKNTLDRKIWNGDFPINYYVNNSNQKVIQDPDFHIFYLLLKESGDNYEIFLQELKKFNVGYFIYKGRSETDNWSISKARQFVDTSPNTAKEFMDDYLKFFDFRSRYLVLDSKIGDFYLYKINYDDAE